MWPLNAKFSCTNGSERSPAARINEVPAIVRLPVGQRDRSQHAIEHPEELWLSDVDFGEPRAANGSKVSVPGKMWVKAWASPMLIL